MGTLKDKVAVVTGCGRPLGMGEAIALKLAEEGARVSICDLCRPITEDLGLDPDLVNRSLGGWEHLEGVVQRIEQLGSQGRAFKTDVADKGEVEDLVAGTVQAFGRLDILVNCAATTVGVGPLLEVSEAAWRKSFDVNVTGPFYAIRAAVPEMLKVGGGRIINIVTETKGGDGYAGYTASKAALVNLTETAATELGPLNILVNAIAPGWIATSMGKDEYAWLAYEQGTSEEEIRRRIRSLIPQRREGRAEEIANVVYFLASPLGSYVAGETISVNGAYHLTDAVAGAFEKQVPKA